jgi:beta-N-acetylhexosaminidase
VRTARRTAIVASLAIVMLLTSCHRTAPVSAPPTASPVTTTPTSPSTAPPTTAPPTTAPPTVGPTRACSNQTVLATWSATRLAEQTVVIPVGEDQVASITAEVQAGAGGVILFGSQAPTDLGVSLARLANAAPDGIAPFIMTDEEGGVVQRMANLVGSMPSARTMAATMTAAQIQQLALTVGRRMKAAGVTMDLAPVLDLDGGPGPSDTNPDGTRSFSPVEATAERDGLAFANGLRAAGVIPVVKHFPGLGGATGNTDSMAAATLPWSNLRTNGLLPFTAAIRSGVPAVMVANATVPGLTGVPASLSSTVITGVLRQQLGFSGLVITDSLSATAIRSAGYSVPGASVQALRAGADLVLYNATPSTVAALTRQVVTATVAAINTGSLARSRLENAVAHILSAKHVNLCQP